MDDNKKVPVACCSYWFDERAFQAYVELYTKPGFKDASFVYIFGGLVRLVIFGGLAGVSTYWLFQNNTPFSAFWFGLLFFYALVAFAIWMIAYGIYVAMGKKRPKWGNARWDGKTQTFWDAMMLEPRLIENPATLGILFINPPLSILFTDQWRNDNRLYYYDLFPYVLPKYKARTSAFNESIPYTAYFYEDGIYFDGNGDGRCFVTSYDQLVPYVEMKREYPGYVLLRRQFRKDEFQILIKVDEFVYGSWQDVRKLILRSCTEVRSDFGKHQSSPDCRVDSIEPLGEMPDSAEAQIKLLSDSQG